jgi:uncharacterized protein YndB with AHSA1/START domain
MIESDGTIRWRVHFDSPPERVYGMLATAAGRRRFWAVSAPDRAGGTIEFHFHNGATLASRVLESVPPSRFRITYFDESVVTFELMADGAGGTDLLLTEAGVTATARGDNHAGWVSVLLALKAAADHDIDLRNHDPHRTWDRGYVDV